VQEARQGTLEARLKDIRLMGDAVIAAFFAADKAKAREAKRGEVEGLFTAALDRAKLAEVAKSLQQGEHPLTPFHWEIEFPEVFARENGGFDAVVGNPPFAGKNTIIAGNRLNYLPWLQTLHKGAHGNADYVAHFFRRAFSLIRQDGIFGLLATNTIGQGDTRATGLAAILGAGGSISRAIKRLQWPGEAAVVVSVVHVRNGKVRSPILNKRQVSRISAYLVEGDFDRAPLPLAANGGKAFIGSFLLGMGFTFDDVAAEKGETESLDAMRALLSKDPRNAERILPYIGGEEVTNSPTHAPHRYAIDFFDFPLRRDSRLRSWFLNEGAEACEKRRREWLRSQVVPTDYPELVAADWPDLLEVVERRVKPERDGQKRKALRERWWQYAEKRPGLCAAKAKLEHVLATNCGASPHLSVASLPAQMVFAHTLCIFVFDRFAPLAVLQSRVHETWARFFASSFEDRLRYTPSDCFETFPVSPGFETDPALEAEGRSYHDHRAALMAGRNEGMTKIYNRFHDRSETADDVERMRELHAEMDRAMLEAYGWHDLAERAAPEFLDETTEDDHTYQGRLFWPSEFRDEVLARLLALNAKRHAEEVRLGIAPGMKGKHGADAEDGTIDAAHIRVTMRSQ
jgi:hypothetical protein